MDCLTSNTKKMKAIIIMILVVWAWQNDRAQDGGRGQANVTFSINNNHVRINFNKYRKNVEKTYSRYNKKAKRNSHQYDTTASSAINSYSRNRKVLKPDTSSEINIDTLSSFHKDTTFDFHPNYSRNNTKSNKKTKYKE